jgi:superfamily II DNA or RNA helicase
MVKLENLTPGSSLRGILTEGLVTVVSVQWYGSDALELTYKDAAGKLGSELIYRDSEAALEIVEAGRPWSFDGDADRFRLVSEAYRIRLAYLFDPMLAVSTSLVEPLPHQITAVYGEMLPRQPLRFLLADDPGAGKTIMTGLLIKELMLRGDLSRCLIVCPGSLVEQWQDELHRRFGLPFEILTNDKLESARTGNWFQENPLALCRLDKLSRNEDVQAKLEQTDWDLVVCDEAHKMSASFFGGEAKFTKRYRLGQFLGGLTRHLLLLTATPHNGKEEDFQLFMALLDGDRFEGRFRDGVHQADTSDLMRRMVKEQLLRFDGRPLFPERRAYTVNYELSEREAELYRQVTEYVRQEFNRADALEGDGRKGTVGFALTTLQRRLASSPEAIYQSLRRRRERLESRLREEKLLKRGFGSRLDLIGALPRLTEEDFEDLDDAPDAEIEELEERVVDQASAARTIEELEAEIRTLQGLEGLAQEVRVSGKDRKWEELSGLLQDNAEMFDPNGRRRKMVIFTEHKDTLNYLVAKIRSLLGTEESVVHIDGSMGREDRKKSENAFLNDPDVMILLATDAAGEGINLQRAHLMANYDLPWNPNRLEQRFGRIHRIGQREVCHLWNLVAAETREGDVFQKLLKKLETEREALGGAVFDVLGQVFQGPELRRLLLEAIRYGDRPDVRARLEQAVDNAMDREHLRELLDNRALARESMDASRVQKIREEMERAEARRLQPHFIASFFLEAFKLLGGSIKEREPRRYEITHVPARIRSRDRQIGTGEPVLTKYERINFEKELISVPGKPMAAFVCPGHPLLDATIDLILEQYRDLLKRGAVLVDPADPIEDARVLFYLEHAIQDGRTDRSGNRRVVSRRMQFVEINSAGETRTTGYAPYLDYRPAEEEELALIGSVLDQQWSRENLGSVALKHAIGSLVPPHLSEIKARQEDRITRTMAAVKERLTKEITYWDHRALELKAQEEAGKQPRMNSQKAKQRADELHTRLQKRLEDLEQERKISALPPVAIGGALVVPAGLLARLRGARTAEPRLYARETKRVELAAMNAVMATERELGFEPHDVGAEKRGYDIWSRNPAGGSLRFIEVKGRIRGADTVTVTKNEILTALNKPEEFILALVEVPPSEEFSGDVHAVRENRPKYGAAEGCRVRYLRAPFQKEPDFGVTSVNYRWQELWDRGDDPFAVLALRSRADLYDDHGGQVRPASRGDWQITGMPPRHVVMEQDGMPVIRYSTAEFDRMRWGVVPREMEQKWFIYAEGDRLFFHRSWTGYCIYVADFDPEDGAFRLTSLTINREPEQYTETNERYDVLLFKYLTDVLLLDREAEFPTHPGDSDEESVLKMWSAAGGPAFGQ